MRVAIASCDKGDLQCLNTSAAEDRASLSSSSVMRVAIASCDKGDL